MELLSVHNLAYCFGAVPALLDVNFAIEPGEVIGVVGQRGAGKSTLFHLLSGALSPSEGEIKVDGRRVTPKTVAHAQHLGIVAVHQQFQLVDDLDVLHNVFLGRELCGPDWFPILPREGHMMQAARAMLTTFDLPLDLIEQRAAVLSTEQRQIVALARAFSHPCRLLLLDDALAVLSFARQQILLDQIKDLAARNVAIIMSSDDLKQIFAVTDRVLVLYQGRQVALRRTSESTPREIVELIVGSNRQERITPVIWAFENYYAAQQQAEELRQAQLELQQNLEEQDSLNRQLIERLHNQVEALDQLNLALQQASRRLITEREAERKALARELHDQIIQDLLSYNYQLEEAEGETADESLRQKLAEIREGIRQVVGSLRLVCSDLRPPTIDHHGLSAAIRSLVSQWSEQTGIAVELQIDPALGRLPETIELSVFRIIQEGLSNVRKHANATRVNLGLRRTSTASLIVDLIDNGQGMGRPLNLADLTEQKHFGLVGISERVSLLGGTLQVTSPPGGGLTLQIEIPSPYPSISDS
ncbi:MAG TPA: ATP-binding cassette domain-containing protein [Anaerolineae bacterium]|nr:ATP-binding cassette domain-containing protein [Anaerolineae bacterium]HQH38321.1 ATP-binding cassette domain-containing protein [Anaerolineae bacterium]